MKWLEGADEGVRCAGTREAAGLVYKRPTFSQVLCVMRRFDNCPGLLRKCQTPVRHFQAILGDLGQLQLPKTVVAEMITELIRFEPKICICNGISWDFQRESVSVMRDSLLTFPQICLCNEINSSGGTTLYL